MKFMEKAFTTDQLIDYYTSVDTSYKMLGHKILDSKKYRILSFEIFDKLYGE